MSLKALARQRLREISGVAQVERPVEQGGTKPVPPALSEDGAVEQRILAALAGHRVLTAPELEAETGLGRRELLEALGRLYDAGELRTNPAAEYWRPFERCPTCQERRSRGERVIFCCRCDFNPKNDGKARP